MFILYRSPPFYRELVTESIISEKGRDSVCRGRRRKCPLVFDSFINRETMINCKVEVSRIMIFLVYFFFFSISRS